MAVAEEALDLERVPGSLSDLFRDLGRANDFSQEQADGFEAWARFLVDRGALELAVDVDVPVQLRGGEPYLDLAVRELPWYGVGAWNDPETDAMSVARAIATFRQQYNEVRVKYGVNTTTGRQILVTCALFLQLAHLSLVKHHNRIRKILQTQKYETKVDLQFGKELNVLFKGTYRTNVTSKIGKALRLKEFGNDFRFHMRELYRMNPEEVVIKQQDAITKREFIDYGPFIYAGNKVPEDTALGMLLGEPLRVQMRLFFAANNALEMADRQADMVSRFLGIVAYSEYVSTADLDFWMDAFMLGARRTLLFHIGEYRVWPAISDDNITFAWKQDPLPSLADLGIARKRPAWRFDV